MKRGRCRRNKVKDLRNTSKGKIRGNFYLVALIFQLTFGLTEVTQWDQLMLNYSVLRLLRKNKSKIKQRGKCARTSNTLTVTQLSNHLSQFTSSVNRNKLIWIVDNSGQLLVALINSEVSTGNFSMVGFEVSNNVLYNYQNLILCYLLKFIRERTAAEY